MEWDKFWSTNTRFHDAKAGRYMAISTDGAVPLTLTDGEGLPSGVEGRTIALHDKNAEVGNKVRPPWYPRPRSNSPVARDVHRCRAERGLRTRVLVCFVALVC